MVQGMLHPKQFDTDEELPAFTIPVENLCIGDLNTGPIEIPASYGNDWEPRFQLGSFVTSNHAIKQMFTPDSPATLALMNSKDAIQLLKSRMQINSQDECVTFEARLPLVPLVLCNSNTSSKFEAVLLFPPDFIKKPITLSTEGSAVFTITPFKTENIKACLLTSNLHCDADNPLAPLSDLITFFTFLKGSHIGLGNLVAFDKDNNIAYQLLGFSRSDQGTRQTNWFDIEIQNDLPAIFAAFTKASSDPTAKRGLTQAINYYRASNTSRNVSLEMAIIAAHTALEAIVNYILEYRACWSKDLMKNRAISFSDKMRAAAAYFELKGEILKHSPELTKLSNARADMDIFGLISFIRNKLVHQDTKFTPTGIQLHEAWTVSQWLVEVLIFGVIGYNGTMIDRRNYQGWRGETCVIPLRH